MYHKQLVEHILNKRSAGMADADIRAELGTDTWSKEDIDLGFYYAESPNKLKSFSIGRILKSEVKASLFAVTIFLALSTVALAFVYTETRVNNYTFTLPETPSQD